MGRFVLYKDTNGKTKVKVSDEALRKDAEEKKRKEEEKIRVNKKWKNEKWLREWIDKRQIKRQERFIEWLREEVPKERWEKYGENTIRRFITKIDIRNDEECWVWIRDLDSSGYGSFKYNRKMVGSHRFFYNLFYGEIPECKPLVLHECHNRKCVNPNHLKCGTFHDNMQDMVIAKRWTRSNDILTDEQVNQMIGEYAEGGTNYFTLSKKYGISMTEVGYIINNKRRKR